MTRDEALSRLEAYERESRAILARFVHSSDSLSIAREDRGRLEQLVIELRDLFDDFLGTNSYSSMVVGAYNEGIANMYHSPSYNSVERIGGIVAAALVRIRNNPDIGKRPENAPTASVLAQSSQPAPSPLSVPERVTLRWLAEHVPVSLWIMLGGALVTAFTLGIAAAKLSIVQEWFAVVPASSQAPAVAPSSTSCSVEGLGMVEEAHFKRVSALQTELLRLEEKASDHNLINSYQEPYRQSAERVRKDIQTENASYHAAIESLAKKCK